MKSLKINPLKTSDLQLLRCLLSAQVMTFDLCEFSNQVERLTGIRLGSTRIARLMGITRSRAYHLRKTGKRLEFHPSAFLSIQGLVFPVFDALEAYEFLTFARYRQEDRSLSGCVISMNQVYW